MLFLSRFCEVPSYPLCLLLSYFMLSFSPCAHVLPWAHQPNFLNLLTSPQCLGFEQRTSSLLTTAVSTYSLLFHFQNTFDHHFE